MKRSPGSTVQEYGLCLGLVVLMAVPALNGVGGSIKNLFSGMSKPESSFANLIGLVDSGHVKSSGGVGVQSPPNSKTSPLLNGTGLRYTVDSSTGRVSFQPDGGVQSGSTTSSVEGGEATLGISQVLATLAARSTDPTERDELETLARLSREIGVQQSKFDNMGIFSPADLTPNYPPLKSEFLMLKERYANFECLYQEIQPRLSSMDPQVAKQLQELAPVVVNTAYGNYLNPKAIGSWVSEHFGMDTANLPAKVRTEIGVLSGDVAAPSTSLSGKA